jgi:LmbE family N-acetylglucosaminyl deacetylase
VTSRAPSASRRPCRQSTIGALALAALALAGAGARAAPASAPEILQELRGFREFGSVLYVAAHPDDENTQLITYLARGRCYRMAYLSLTRGDGGQNVIGPEFGDQLGVIRTQELLAARRVDGGRQFFSRARDFGYSKDYRATLTKWDREEVLADIVRVIRTFRPDIIVTRFPPEPGSTHGHHTASAALALEAFALAGDPNAFPEQLATLAPWQPRRILWNSWGAFRGAPTPAPGSLHLGIDGTDPVTGASFAVLAARSRSMHRTQGFANFTVASSGSGPHTESFSVLAGEPAREDIMDGVDTTWGRVPGGADIGRMAGEVIDRFDPSDPAASVPALLALKRRLAALDGDPVVEEKRGQLDWILQACLGLWVETTVPSAEVVPGETIPMHHTATVASAVPVRWVGVRYPGMGPATAVPADLAPGKTAAVDAGRTLPADTPLSQPYWLREEGTPGMFRVDDPALIGLPENPPAVRVEDVFEVGGQILVVRDEAVKLVPGPDGGEVRRRLDVIPPVTVSFSSPVGLFAPGSSRKVTVEVEASRADIAGTLRLVAPPGWRASPAGVPFRLAAVGDRASAVFTVTAPPGTASDSIAARADIDGTSYGNGRVLLSFSHIPPQLLMPPARMRAVSLDLAIRGRRVGYIPGAGDSVAGSLALMGYEVVTLSEADLTPEGLSGLDAVVIGVRALNARKEIADRLPALFAFAEAGGTVVEQYNTPGGLQTPSIAPYALEISRDLPKFRVTDEAAPVRLLVPGHPVFTGPNRIGSADFDGWVQERGLDFASKWDAGHFTALLACSDAGEPPLEGGLLVASHGRGYFVYTGLSFFRQLPAGVPGAYRLFANLVSLGR